MKKFLVTALLAFTLSALFAPIIAFAQEENGGFFDQPTVDILKEFQEESGFRTFVGADIEGASEIPGLDTLTGAILTVISIMKYAVGGLALLFLVVTLIRLITAGEKSDEELDKLMNTTTEELRKLYTARDIEKS